MMKERRQYPRYHIKLPVHFRTLSSKSEAEKRSGKYWTKDVSMGGIRFETGEDLPQGTPLTLELHLPKATFSEFVKQEPMLLQGRVAWKGQNRADPGLYEIGVEFVALLEQEQNRIEECIVFFLKEEERNH